MGKQRKREGRRTKKKKKALSVLLGMALLAGVVPYPPAIVHAAANTVHITEGTLNHADHRTMNVGERRSGWEIECNNGQTVKTATWSTTDAKIATVTGNTQTATVTAHKEGTTTLKLSVTTKEGEKLTTDCVLSVVTKLSAEQQAAGIVTEEAGLYRGASTASTKRNTALAGQTLTVIAQCGDFYRVKLPASYDFNDTLNQDTAYMLKSKIRIPVTSLTIAGEQERKLNVGETLNLQTTVLPELATEPSVSWKSSNPEVANVSSSGTVKAIAAGTAEITATEPKSGIKEVVSVTVSDIFLSELKIVTDDKVAPLLLGKEAQLRIQYQPDNASKKDIRWESSHPDVVSVNQNGKIKAIQTGRATITASDTCSGKKDTLAVWVSYSLGAKKQKALSTKKPKIALKTATDFRGIYLKWSKIKGAKYYRLYREHWDKKKKKYVRTYKNGKWLKTKEYTDTAIEKNKSYRYYVVAYQTKKKAISVSAKKAKKVKVKATAPTVTVTATGLDSVELNWQAGIAGKTKGIKGYQVIRRKKKNGKPEKIFTKNKKTHKMTDKGLTQGTTYYYTVQAYTKKKKKTIPGAASNMVRATTISAAKNLSYLNRAGNTFHGIYKEGVKRTQSESTDRMRNYALTVRQESGKTETVFPYLKYHYAGDTLYIHLYVCFLKHSDATGQDEPVSTAAVVYGDGIRGGSYKEEFIKGVTSVYSTEITGNTYDFEPGVKFRTQLVLHEIEKETYAVNQQFLRVSLGGECPHENCSCEYWPHCSAEPEGCPYTLDRMIKRKGVEKEDALLSDKVLHMPDINNLVYSDGSKFRPYSLYEYKTTCAHELGHILGLGDGYEDEDWDGRKVIRMTYTVETCAIIENGQWGNIMIKQSSYCKIRPNDMEMILMAYGKAFVQAIDNEEAMQYYKEHEWYGQKENKSEAIKKKEEKQR